MKRAITIADLERSLAVLAKVVARYGDVYLPIFQRMEFELAAAQEREAALARARKMANDSH